MIFYVILNQVATVFLGLNLLTTLSFDSEIMNYLYGGAKDDIFFQVTNNQKTLAIKPKDTKGFSNLMVVTKNRKYYFKLDYDSSNPHQFIEVKDGVMNHGLTKKIINDEFEVLEGDSSLLFINKGKKEIIVNGVTVKKSEYISKGVPVIFEGKRILY